MDSWKIALLIIILICFSVRIFAGADVQENGKKEIKPITGSFIQAWGKDLEMNPVEWGKELSSMRKVGMNLLIVQFTIHYGKAFFNSDESPTVTGAQMTYLENLLQAAGQSGMYVMIGLNFDPMWFNTTESEKYIEKSLDFNIRLIRQIGGKYAGHKAFYGWYFPEEIFDTNFETPEKLKKLAEFFSLQIAVCKKLAPGKPVAVSPFYSGHMDARQYYDWWNDFLSKSGFDIVMLQDGVGVHGTSRIETIVPIYKALRKACDNNKVQTWGNLELFQQIHGWPVDNKPPQADPATAERLARQIEYISPFVDNLVSFDFHNYMNPSGGLGKAKLYNDYKKYYDEHFKEAE